MLNFDSQNKDHLLLAIVVLKYFSFAKTNGSFKAEGKGSFNINAFCENFKVKDKKGNYNASHRLNSLFTDARTKNQFNLGKKYKTSFETYLPNIENYSAENIEYEYINRENLEFEFPKIESTKILPVSLAQRVFEEIFYMPKKDENTILLPENFLHSDICKRIEFNSRNLFTCVITSTLKWAYDNREQIIASASKNDCQFRYIITSEIANDNLDEFKEYVKNNNLEDKIKFAKIETLLFDGGGKEKLEIKSNIKIPIANDLVIYSNLPQNIIEKCKKFTFKTNNYQYETIALNGTFPQGFDFEVENQYSYYDILVSKDSGKNILKWFNDVWKQITGETNFL